jgi:hypothetical protein
MKELAGQRQARRRRACYDQMLVFDIDEQIGDDIGTLLDDGESLNRMNAVHRWLA